MRGYINTLIIGTCITLFAIAGFFVQQANAQLTPVPLQSIELTTSSSAPAPGQQVTVTLTGRSTDVNSAMIVWYENGVEAKRGTGLTTHVVKAPELGKKKTISVSVVALSGRTSNASIEMGSGAVDMIVETNGYVHPFFEGKLTPVFQNDIKIVAMPHLADASGVEYNPTSLVYKWEKDGIALSNESGYGKQALYISGNTVPRPFTISVTVGTRDGTKQAKSITTITFKNPSLAFYANDPLYGPLFNKQLSGRVYLSTQRELGVLAVPFGFNKPSNALGDLRMSWFINGSEKGELSQNESIIIRSPESSFGTSDISLRIKNAVDILQGAENLFSVSFRASSQEDSAREDVIF